MALAVLPSKSFIKITVSGTADYWTSNQGFLVGDIITVSGSKFIGVKCKTPGVPHDWISDGSSYIKSNNPKWKVY